MIPLSCLACIPLRLHNKFIMHASQEHRRRSRLFTTDHYQVIKAIHEINFSYIWSIIMLTDLEEVGDSFARFLPASWQSSQGHYCWMKIRMAMSHLFYKFHHYRWSQPVFAGWLSSSTIQSDALSLLSPSLSEPGTSFARGSSLHFFLLCAWGRKTPVPRSWGKNTPVPVSVLFVFLRLLLTLYLNKAAVHVTIQSVENMYWADARTKNWPVWHAGPLWLLCINLK